MTLLVLLHPTVERLVETVVDSPRKLHILLRLREQPQLITDAPTLADQLFCDIWSADAALCELAADGMLAVVCDVSLPCFQYAPRPQHHEPLRLLFAAYDDPFQREALHHLLREVSAFAPYRRAARQQRRPHYRLQSAS